MAEGIVFTLPTVPASGPRPLPAVPPARGLPRPVPGGWRGPRRHLGVAQRRAMGLGSGSGEGAEGLPVEGEAAERALLDIEGIESASNATAWSS